MLGHYTAIDRTQTGRTVSVKCVTSGSENSWVETSRMRLSADILGLKFLPVRSEGSFEVLPLLGDLA